MNLTKAHKEDIVHMGMQDTPRRHKLGIKDRLQALRLADELDAEFAQGRISNHTGRKAATELRLLCRLHSENETLQAGYAAARLEIESLQVRIKTMAEEHADELMVAHMDGRMRASHGQAPAQAAEGCTRSHPHENMDSACRAKAAIAEMQNMAARGAEATTHDLERFVAMLAAAPTTQPAPQQEAQEPVAWYVTGCNRLLDEDEAKAEARHIGGTARAIPLYTAPQAESQPVPVPRWDEMIRQQFPDMPPKGWSDTLIRRYMIRELDAYRAARAAPPAQPAPVRETPADLPPLPDPDLRDVGTNPEDIKNFLRGYATEYAKVALAAHKQGANHD